MASLTVLREVDVSGDGGIIKKVYREGTGDETPAKGDKVEAHYTGTLTDGEKFDSSRDRGKVFKFDIGKGSVIKGWDQGCLGMKIGETRKLTIPGHEGYGAGGFPAWGIPPNGTLEFTLECLKIQ